MQQFTKRKASGSRRDEKDRKKVLSVPAMNELTSEILMQRVRAEVIIRIHEKSVSLPPPKTKPLHNVRKPRVFLWGALGKVVDIVRNIMREFTKRKASGSSRDEKDRKKILSVSTYPIYPPKGGGQSRVFYLCRELSKVFDVHVICLVDGAESATIHQISDSFSVEYVPANKAFRKRDRELYRRSGIPTTDVVMVDYYEEASSFIKTIRSAITKADVLIAEQSYVYPLLLKYSFKNQILIYNSQNVELTLKKQMFCKSPMVDMVCAWVEKAESKACRDADLIVYCSAEDKVNMEHIYPQISCGTSTIIENCAASETISYLSSSERRKIKDRVYPNGSIGLFVASWHQPNIDAVRDLSIIASQTPEILYIVVGSVSAYFDQSGDVISGNIIFTGMVSDDEKDLFLQLADFAVNPMSTGSGTNIKMFDYLAAGLPLISTEVGMRGIEAPKGFVSISTLDNFPSTIKSILNEERNIQKRLFIQGRYDWRAVGFEYIDAIQRLL